MQIDETVSFGEYVWNVLDIQEDRALLITRDIVELSAFHNRPGEMTWADSDLRRYLNEEFYNRFSDEEKARIVEVTLQNHDNPWFDTRGGAETRDRVFLLSIEEAVYQYFGDSSKNLQVPNGKYKYWFTRKDANNEKRVAEYLQCSWWWWLRSPGRKQAKAAYVHGDGNIGIQGNNAYKCNLTSAYHPVTNDVKGGVRPALWIRL